jgi:hypothetical protein
MRHSQQSNPGWRIEPRSLQRQLAPNPTILLNKEWFILSRKKKVFYLLIPLQLKSSYSRIPRFDFPLRIPNSNSDVKQLLNPAGKGSKPLSSTACMPPLLLGHAQTHKHIGKVGQPTFKKYTFVELVFLLVLWMVKIGAGKVRSKCKLYDIHYVLSLKPIFPLWVFIRVTCWAIVKEYDCYSTNQHLGV